MKRIQFITGTLAFVIASGAAAAASPAVVASGSGDPVPIYRSLDGRLRASAAPHNTLCMAANGDEVEIQRGVALEGGREFWLLVRVLSGPCAGTEGWLRGTQAKPRN